MNSTLAKDLKDNPGTEILGGQHKSGVTTWKCVTDDFTTVRNCQNDGKLHSLALKWSWRTFNWMYVFEFEVHAGK